jgi:ribosomal protein S18 acetylase RimI-like enzyme
VTEAGLSIVEFNDALAGQFYDINAQWIESMFVLEDHDRHVLSHPRETIIDPGGVILFVATPTLGIVGACALMPTGDGEFELTKMGVLEQARGLKAGEFLLDHVIKRAQLLRAKKLYLLTSKKCAAAIHLYEKLGFVHSKAIMADYSQRYERCDVAMDFPL